jgi:hypothetical protein
MTHYERASTNVRDEYEVIAVTELSTEWTNVFYDHRAEPEERWFFERSPAMLLVEKVATIRNYVEGGKHRYAEKPYDGIRRTMAFFATVCTLGLEPLQLGESLGYLGTFPGGEPDQAARQQIYENALANGDIKLPEGQSA